MNTVQQKEIAPIRGRRAQASKSSSKSIIGKEAFLKSIRNGIIAGVVMAIYVFIVEASTDPRGTSYLRPISYIFMLGIFYFALKNYKAKLPKGKIFKRGAVMGIYMSTVAAIVLVGLMALLEFFFLEIGFSVFNREVHTLGEAVVFDWILLAQTFVFGILSTFVVLQGIKDTHRTD
ncbi:MAG: hypothetical protein AAF849_08935 [Bacteroidota bacterium]